MSNQQLIEQHSKRIEELSSEIRALDAHSAEHRLANTDAIAQTQRVVKEISDKIGHVGNDAASAIWKEISADQIDPRDTNLITELECAATDNRGNPLSGERKVLYDLFRKRVVAVWKQCCAVCQGRGHRDRRCPSRKKLLKLAGGHPDWASVCKIARANLAKRYNGVRRTGEAVAPAQLFMPPDK